LENGILALFCFSLYSIAVLFTRLRMAFILNVFLSVSQNMFLCYYHISDSWNCVKMPINYCHIACFESIKVAKWHYLNTPKILILKRKLKSIKPNEIADSVWWIYNRLQEKREIFMFLSTVVIFPHSPFNYHVYFVIMMDLCLPKVVQKYEKKEI
jgi:hypothetical protein